MFTNIASALFSSLPRQASPPRFVYTQPTRVNEGGRCHFYRGARARGGGINRDHDGVPNR